jgi:transketolase
MLARVSARAPRPPPPLARPRAKQVVVAALSFSAPVSRVSQARVARANVHASTLVTNEVALARAADESRGLSMDSIAAAHSGHLGLPLGAAEVGAVLFGQEMSYLPTDPQWLNRDRFVLSGGHGSMFLYAWLVLRE